MASPPNNDDSPSSSTPPSPPSQNNSSSSPSPSPPPPSQGNFPPPPPPSFNQSPPPPSPQNSNSSPPPPPPSKSSGNNSPPPPHPPPPPHSPPHRSPPSYNNNNNNHNNHNNNNTTSNGNSSSPSPFSSMPQTTKIIIGAAVGGGLLLLVMLLCTICSRRRKRRSGGNIQYFTDGSLGGNGYYYNPPPPPRTDHVVKFQPAQVSSEHGGWAAPPPPPPPMPYGGSGRSSCHSGPFHPPLPPPHPAVALGFNQSTFTYEELAAATGGFSASNLLGQGGFGLVHKGVLPTGKEIAVKSLKSGGGQGEREFQAEVEIISRVHHRHLVSLVGYCISGSKRLLIYEFVPNNTLEFHLHGEDRPTMVWSTRMRIALGAAKGLAYLHEDCHPQVIHRDIKASNILLDYNFEAKVADFGLAKLSNENYTHVSTRIMGTFGYLAPEYASSGKLTEKSDVFSFGIMLLELITGKCPVNSSDEDVEDCLVDWARPHLLHAMEVGDYKKLVDPCLDNNYNPREMARMVGCAAAAVRQSARRRPKMSQIVRALEGDASLDDLNEGVVPGHSKIIGSGGSSDFDAHVDMKKLKNAALSSQEFANSEYGASAEYSQQHSTSSRESGETGLNGRQTHMI